METAKNLLWCVLTSFVVCAVAILLLMLGSWMGGEAEAKVKGKEKIVTCAPIGKGWSKCETEWI